MINFYETWLPGILWYCAFILDEEMIRRVWIEHDRSHTSVMDYDELYMQLFSDLDSDIFFAELAEFLPDAAKRKAISDFLLSIKSMDTELASILEKKDYQNLFVSRQWKAVKESAQSVITEFRQ